MASSPAWPCCAVRPPLGSGLGTYQARPTEPPASAIVVPTAPYYSGNPGPESKICPFWVMPPPEVGELEEGKLRDMDVSGQGGVASGQRFKD